MGIENIVPQENWVKISKARIIFAFFTPVPEYFMTKYCHGLTPNMLFSRQQENGPMQNISSNLVP